MAPRARSPRTPRARAARPPAAPAALDQAARQALDDVDDSPAAQLAALAALDALVTALPETGVLRALVMRERAERAGAFRVRHLKLVDEAIATRERLGPRAHEDVVKALERALQTIAAMEGESGQVRTLRLQLGDARRGFEGRPRPFFARFLEGQRR